VEQVALEQAQLYRLRLAQNMPLRLVLVVQVVLVLVLG
jgi:hypothetical protein